jgi:GR25 family glycosyltransferase involved in LPS biosynthesis
MSINIDKIIYINLNKREDRREEIEKELQDYSLSFERFEAIEKNYGLGSLMSHLEVLKIARERQYKNILIFEDDFQFIVSKEKVEEELSNLFDSNIDFDVCFLINGAFKIEDIENYSFIKRTTHSSTASAYIVKQHYYDTLIELYEENVPLLESTGLHWLYTNDKCWDKLQMKDKWYLFTNPFGKQRPGYSDNSQSYTNYDDLFNQIS